MKFTPYVAFRLMEDFVKRENVTGHMSRLRKYKYADPEILHNYKLKALKRLLKHAYQNVPFYKKRFENHGIHPEDIKSFDDFAQFPLLSREDIKKCGHDLLSTNAKETGGSTWT